ncbi:MAG: helicase-related protein, partial [Acetobacteraceae bacterium]
ALGRGIDVLVATPGRLQDHLEQGSARLDHVSTRVLVESDQMLDKGFLPAIRRLIRAVPAERQTLFFSATMPVEINRLADEMLKSPVRVAVAPVATTAEKVAQRVIHANRQDKRRVLAELLRGEGVGRALIFSRTKHGADRIVNQLDQDGIRANAIHGNKSQNAREAALAAFRDGRAPVLVATDIAARGIDVDGVTHVIQFDLPEVPETYVHRIGRTARAAASGQLYRNFQGYTTDGAPVLLGLGASAIGRCRAGFFQNIADERGWLAVVEAARLPIARGRAFTHEDLIRAQIIERIMCDQTLDLAPVPTDILASARAKLDPLISDGLVVESAGRLAMTARGARFLRHFAACFDAYLAPAAMRHSAAV